jgi:hypothetical protein
MGKKNLRSKYRKGVDVVEFGRRTHGSGDFFVLFLEEMIQSGFSDGEKRMKRKL